MSLLEEFREFVSRGSVIDMAVGILIGGAFATVVTSFVDDLLMPPLGLLLGGADFSDLFLTLRQGSPRGPYANLELARDAGAVTLNLGLFLTRVVAFALMAAALFALLKTVNQLRRPEPAPKTQDCAHCKSSIHPEATRCPHCTSELVQADAREA